MPQAASLGDAPEEEQAGAVGGGAGAAHRQKLGREGKGEGDRGLWAAGPVSGVAAEGRCRGMEPSTADRRRSTPLRPS